MVRCRRKESGMGLSKCCSRVGCVLVGLGASGGPPPLVADDPPHSVWVGIRGPLSLVVAGLDAVDQDSHQLEAQPVRQQRKGRQERMLS